MRTRPMAALGAVLVSAAISACSKPQPPTIVPKEAQVTELGPAGVTVLVRVEATNPNGVELTARSVTGKAKLAGKWQLGTITINKPIVLPPHAPTMIDAPMTLPWSDMNALRAFVGAGGPVPYEVEGTVTIGGDRLNAELPFKLTGTITHRQVIGAALKSIPTVPGIAVPHEE